jgi:nicotinate-nucleotide adenylyltransferase
VAAALRRATVRRLIRVRPNPRRIGILGGTFDPIHTGHLDLADAASLALNLTRMYLITANMPPHRPQPHASSFHRFAMASLAVAGRQGWRASDLELRSPLPSYTSETLGKFHEREYQPGELFFVMGADSFAEIGAWHAYPEILDAAHFVVVSRPGFPAEALRRHLPHLADRMSPPPVAATEQTEPLIILIDAPTSDVSSTAIRRRCTDGLSIAGMVPALVQQHIEQHGLYTSMTPGRRAADAPRTSPAGRMHDEN